MSKKEPNGKSYLSASETKDGFTLLMEAEKIKGYIFKRKINLSKKHYISVILSFSVYLKMIKIN